LADGVKVASAARFDESYASISASCMVSTPCPVTRTLPVSCPANRIRTGLPPTTGSAQVRTRFQALFSHTSTLIRAATPATMSVRGYRSTRFTWRGPPGKASSIHSSSAGAFGGHEVHPVPVRIPSLTFASTQPHWSVCDEVVIVASAARLRDSYASISASCISSRP
jgi:hypothetical protein